MSLTWWSTRMSIHDIKTIWYHVDPLLTWKKTNTIKRLAKPLHLEWLNCAGYCWFIAVAAVLATKNELFQQVVPSNQDFDKKNYAGIESTRTSVREWMNLADLSWTLANRCDKHKETLQLYDYKCREVTFMGNYYTRQIRD